jgi:hypothetical protein
MKSFARRVQLRRALGVCAFREEMFLTEVAATPLGTVVLRQETLPYANGEELAAVTSALQAVGKDKNARRLSVGVALPATQAYCFTREESSDPHGTGEENDLPAFLRGAVAPRGGQLLVEQQKFKLDGRPFTTVMACAGSQVTKLGQVAAAAGLRPLLFQPLPLAAAQAACPAIKVPRKARLWTMIALNEGLALMTLLSGRRVLAWREFPLPPEDPATRVKREVLRMLAYASKTLLLDIPETVCVAGQAQCAKQAVSALGDVGLDVVEVGRDALPPGQEASLGVALACLEDQTCAWDLGRSLRPPPRPIELIPWADIALTGALILVLWLAMGNHLSSLQQRLHRQRTDNGHLEELHTASDQELKDRAAALTGCLSAYNGFQENRETWSLYLEEAPQWLPAAAHLIEVQAEAPLPTGRKDGAGKKAVERSLVLTGAVDAPSDGSAPPEVDQFVEALRHKEVLKRSFPIIELANVRWRKDGPTGYTVFTVGCFPKREFKAISRSASHEG